jgi:DNA sulfur modification protein DndB
MARTKISDDVVVSDRVPRGGMFEYRFPAIRGVQAGREYYVTMCPLRLIPRLFLFDEEELLPEMRAQRSLNKARIPELSRYILDNSNSYVFSALTASVDADVVFAPLLEGKEPEDRIGTLVIPMSARFVINDGQHRRAAIQQALADNPELGDETIAIVLFLDIGLARCQQMFADLNRHAVRPSKSIGVLYDSRDEMSILTKRVVFDSPLLRDLTELETSNLAARSRKLFTLSALYNANRSLLEGFDGESLERRTELASQYWAAVADYFPEWRHVNERLVTAGEVRRDFIHSHGIVLHALGKVGGTLLRRSTKPASWRPYLKHLADIDWRRTNPEWEGRATLGGKVSKSAANVLLTTATIRGALGLELTPEEQRHEDMFDRGEP